jgi:ubiquinone/menaquinone biosynthesis C-methylase UbiE
MTNCSAEHTSKSRVEEAMDSWASIYDDFMTETGNLRAQITSAQRLLPYIEGRDVLEVGVGTGIIATYFAKMTDAKIVGVDFSDEMIRKLEKKIGKYNLNIKVRYADAESLPFEESSFNVVYSCFVMNFFTDKTKALQEMRRVCKKSGYIILMEDEGTGEVDKTAESKKTKEGWSEVLKKVKEIKTVVTPPQIKDMMKQIDCKLEREFREEINSGHNLLTMIYKKDY